MVCRGVVTCLLGKLAIRDNNRLKGGVACLLVKRLCRDNLIHSIVPRFTSFFTLFDLYQQSASFFLVLGKR